MYRTLNYNNYLTFRKAEDIEVLKRMHYITLWRTRFGRGCTISHSGELLLEEAMDLS
jgi:hypothetical protein